MKKRLILSILMAVLVLNLASCGSKGSIGSDKNDGPEAVVGGSDQTNQAGPGVGEDNPPAGVITPSHTDVTLKSAGDSFCLTPVGVEGIYACTYTVADPSIASVDETDGTVTAISLGSTTVTMHVEGNGVQTNFDCTVRCAWSDGGSGSESGAQSLTDFFETLKTNYEGLSSLGVLEGELLEAYYPGLTALPVQEMLVQENMMSIQNSAVVLLKLSDSASAADVTAAQEILSARIKTQAEGGAFYPESCEVWENGVITAAANAVGMFVYPEEAQSMADDFTAAFSK